MNKCGGKPWNCALGSGVLHSGKKKYIINASGISNIAIESVLPNSFTKILHLFPRRTYLSSLFSSCKTCIFESDWNIHPEFDP
jgi:hypothetical protein